MSAHERGGWSRIGSVFYGGEVALGCTCGWRSDFTEDHQRAEHAFAVHSGTDRCCSHSAAEHISDRCVGVMVTHYGTGEHMRHVEPCYCLGGVPVGRDEQ